MPDHYPKRIICLTDETTELLYLLGEQDRIVGISGFSMRPPQARKEKPKVATFMEAKTDEVMDLQPDLVIGYSDIQANMAKELIARGVTVWVNNHRSVQGILSMMVQLGALVGKESQARELVGQAKAQIAAIQQTVTDWPIRPRVYFEEWYEPMISGVQWVSEIITLAGGEDILPEFTYEALAKDRIIQGPATVAARNPDIILASWCGKMLKKEQVIKREGWAAINAVKQDDIYDIPSGIILQPGPAAVMEGLPAIHEILKAWVKKQKN